MKKVGFIALRKGTKGVLNKNKRKMVGRPIFSWVLTLDLDEIIVYTDDNDIKSIGFSGHHLSKAVGAASLEPMGLRKLSRDLRAVHKALSFKSADILPIEQVQRDKLKNKKV